jgi:hypothetical protein
MTTTDRRTQPLSDDDVRSMLALMKGSDTVELKLTVPDEGHRWTINALALDPIAAQIRQVFFLDTPDLSLNKIGVVVRARRVQGKSADSVVKLRPVEPSELPDDLRRSPAFGVEVDAMPGGYVCSASLKGVTDNVQVREAVTGRKPVRKLFSKAQRRFYDAHAPEGVGLNDLTVLGPIFVLKLKWVPLEIARRMVAELWLYPDGSRILELSTKCRPNEAFQVAAETKAFLNERGVDLSGEQQTKTKKALEFFSKELSRATTVQA